MSGLLGRIDGVVSRLKAGDVRAGTRVAVLVPNSAEYALLIAACLRLGAVAAPISTRYTSAGVRSAVRTAGAEVLIDAMGMSNPSEFIRTLAWPDLVEPVGDLIGQVTLDSLGVAIDHPCSIIMTSGSGGTPRGVMHRLAAHVENARGAGRVIPFQPGDCWLMSLPMYHISGFSILIRAWDTGAAVRFPSANEKLEEALTHDDVTHLSLVPVQLARLMESPNALARLRRFKAILVGGAAASPRLIRDALEHDLPIHTTYGSTEAASQVTTSRAGELSGREHTSGRLLSGRRLKIDAEGRILLAGSTMLDGYLLDGRLAGAVNGEGWLETGDIGRVDEHGHLTVLGRRDAMFISGGENIHPEEIERCLDELPDVERSLVVGVARGEMGRRPVAWVRSRIGAAWSSASAIEALEGRLERFKVPIAFLPWPEAWNEAVKVNRREAAERAQALLGQRD
ncbi:MAG: o-succinylbenzoate--CoA ligase [Phycisphaeraceae bacterium]|nr:o-succinylbenzoate--CoA ligase [Phycisphaeraceae bacterium]